MKKAMQSRSLDNKTKVFLQESANSFKVHTLQWIHALDERSILIPFFPAVTDCFVALPGGTIDEAGASG
jgi:hypothetical protein